MRVSTAAAASILVAAALLAGTPLPAAAQAPARYALLIEGASGTDEYATLHRAWLDELAGRLRGEFGFDNDRVHVLAETPHDGELPANADSVRTVLERLAGQVAPNDLLFVMLIGHGSGQGDEAKFNLVGRDLTVAEWAELMTPVRGRVAFVNASSSSSPYLAGLAGENRIVITATASPAQRIHPRFGGEFVAALGSADADADKNGRISLLEAFDHASTLVAQYYEQQFLRSTETAMIDDDGNGEGRPAEGEGTDGLVASLTYLATEALPTSADPEVQQLIERQAELTALVDDLRRRRPTLSQAAFDAEFERLIIELSLVSRDVRRRTGG